VCDNVFVNAKSAKGELNAKSGEGYCDIFVLYLKL